MSVAATKAARTAPVKNRAPAPIQISAEQLVLESRDRAMAAAPPPPRRHIADGAELAEHRMRTRKEFEDKIRLNRNNMSTWLRYARWEEQQGEIERARSVYERTLDIDYKNVSVWLRYAEMEMKAKFINRARNVWDRAVSLLPRVDSLWYKYTFMEEMLGNVANARLLFERWMEWEPAAQAWLSYINLETRAGDAERARAVYERYIACHPSEGAYIKFAKWETRNGQRALARRVYERSLEELRGEEVTQRLFLAFAAFEESCGEHERARVIFRFGLERLPKEAAGELYAAHVSFEKKHGDRKGIEDVITAKRRAQYEEAARASPLNYDVWFDYVRLEEAEGDTARVREVYERAVANVPPLREKRFWRRYIYLWINYALYEELVAKDAARARAVYAAALKVVPHEAFTFGKLWLLAARLEVRAMDMPAARRLLGTSLGLCPKANVLRGYIEMETRLGEIDRVRKLHEKAVSLWPFAAGGWCAFAALEAAVGESERARAIYEIAVSQPSLDMPEAAWKAYIDYEIEAGEAAAARSLYERLLARTQHVKVWMSYAAFEASIVGSAEGARHVYKRGYDHFKGVGDEGKEDRALMVEMCRAFEQGILDDEEALGEEGDPVTARAHLAAVEKLLPRRVVRVRPVLAADGSAVGSEEFFDYVFPDDEGKAPGMKLLEAAKRWKAAAAAAAAAAASGGGGGGGDGYGGGGDDGYGGAGAGAVDVDAVLRATGNAAAVVGSTAELGAAAGFFGGRSSGASSSAAGGGMGIGRDYGEPEDHGGAGHHAEQLEEHDGSGSGSGMRTSWHGSSATGLPGAPLDDSGRPGFAAGAGSVFGFGFGGGSGGMLRRQVTGFSDQGDEEAEALADANAGAGGIDSGHGGAGAGAGAVGQKRSLRQAFESGSSGGHDGSRVGAAAGRTQAEEEEGSEAHGLRLKQRRLGLGADDDAGAGEHVPTPMGSSADPNALDLDAADGDGQDGSAGGAVDAVAAERAAEDRVKSAATASQLPRDLYSEEEAAAAGDRDP